MGSILTQARAMAANGTLSAGEVGKLVSKALEDGRLSYTEKADLKKVQEELTQELSPSARRALNTFLGLGDTFNGNLARSLFDVSDDDAEALERQGILNNQSLLSRTRTPSDRANLAGASRVDIATLTSLVEQADLARAVGVGKTFAKVLNAVGINTIQELGQQNATQLRRQITSFLRTSEGQAITQQRPGANTVKGWINSAKGLPKMILEQGEQSFTRADFMALNDWQKRTVLRGWDVRLQDGTMFESDDLSVEVPQRKPANITAWIENAERNGFDSELDYAEFTGDSVTLRKVERIKIGDETLGFRVELDVTGRGSYEYEGMTGDDVPMTGEAWACFDHTGNMIGTVSADVWPEDY
jgi:hypothetical protein